MSSKAHPKHAGSVSQHVEEGRMNDPQSHKLLTSCIMSAADLRYGPTGVGDWTSGGGSLTFTCMVTPMCTPSWTCCDR